MDKKYLNCFTYVIQNNGRTFYRKGIKCEIAKNGRILLNGMGKYQIFDNPATHTSDERSDEYLLDLFEKHYGKSCPWLAYEEDGLYLYSAMFLEGNRYFKPYNENHSHVDYLMIEAPDEVNLGFLGGGAEVLFRYFANGRQYAMFECKNGGVIRYRGYCADVILDYTIGGHIVSV